MDIRSGQPPLAALSDYIRALFRWRKAVEEAEAGDTSGLIKLSKSQIDSTRLLSYCLPIFSKRHQLKEKTGSPVLVDLLDHSRGEQTSKGGSFCAKAPGSRGEI